MTLTIDNRNLPEHAEYLQDRIDALTAVLKATTSELVRTKLERDELQATIARMTGNSDLSFLLHRSIQLEQEARSVDTESK